MNLKLLKPHNENIKKTKDIWGMEEWAFTFIETGNIFKSWTVRHENKNWYSSQDSIKIAVICLFGGLGFFLGIERFLKQWKVLKWWILCFGLMRKNLVKVPLWGIYWTDTRESLHLNVLQMLLLQPLQLWRESRRCTNFMWYHYLFAV